MYDANAEAKKDPGVWKDDGCGFTGTAEEVDDHIMKTNRMGRGQQMLPLEQIRCWGRTKVEGGRKNVLGIWFGPKED